MKWYEIIGLLGSLVSIMAAIYTSRYSTIVKKTKNEILSLFKVVKFSNISETTQTVLEQIKKVAHKQTISRGTNLNDLVNSLNNYYEKIFKLKTENEVAKNEKLNSLIETFRLKTDAVSATQRDQQSAIIELFNELYQLTLNIDQEFNKLTKSIVEK